MSKRRKVSPEASKAGAALSAFRMTKMTPAQRREVAKIAAEARWRKAEPQPEDEREAVSA